MGAIAEAFRTGGISMYLLLALALAGSIIPLGGLILAAIKKRIPLAVLLLVPCMALIIGSFGAAIGIAEALEAIFAAREVGAVLLGLPRNMDGTEGPRCQATRAFARNLAARIDLPIGFWDERLSTVAAERALLEADTSRRRRAEVIDHVAASFILQGALDRMRHLEREG